MHTIAYRSPFTSALLLFLIYFIPIQAFPQSASDNHEQRLRQQRQDQERKTRQNAPDARIPDTTQKASGDSTVLPQEKPCFTLTNITVTVPASLPQASQNALSGHFWAPLAFAQREANRFKGQCAGQQGINQIISHLTNTALAKGYSTTRFGITQQDLSSGTLNITVIPGLVRQIQIKDAPARSSWKSAFPVRTGDLLNLRDLEQGLEQMKHATSQDADMQIVPADQPGESDIVIALKRSKSWFGSASLDNSGAKDTGRYQLGTRLGFDNPLGFNDTISANITSNADAGRSTYGTKNAGLNYWIPYGYWSLEFNTGYATHKQTTAGEYGPLESHGDSRNADMTLQRLLHRNQTQKNTLQLKIGKRWARETASGIHLDNQDRRIAYIELGMLHKHYIQRAQLDISVTQRWAKGVRATATETLHPTSNYTMQILDTSLSVPFNIMTLPLSYSTTLHGQTSPQALYSADHISLGSRYTIRGFDEVMSLSAEKGFYWRNELAIPLGATSHMLYTGIDAGKLYGPNTDVLAGTMLSGAALGVRGSLFGVVSYDTTIGMPIKKPAAFTTKKFNLTVNLAASF
jgi:hemolysin activation/secretion protein